MKCKKMQENEVLPNDVIIAPPFPLLPPNDVIVAHTPPSPPGLKLPIGMNFQLA